jgi:hypothetical protein
VIFCHQIPLYACTKYLYPEEETMSAEKITGGYAGKVLRVNLSNRNITTEEIGEAFCRKYLGGAGFISY